MSYQAPSRVKIIVPDDPSDELYQKHHWKILRKSINGLINKLNRNNITEIVPLLIDLNLVRGSGLLCKSLMKSQQLSLLFTPVYSSCVAILNSKFPSIGELLIKRLVIQFKKSYKRQQKPYCLAITTFIAHLTNQYVVHELVILQILFLFLENPTDDSIELSVNVIKESGQVLSENSPKALIAIFDRLRGLLHDTKLHIRIQYMIEVLFQVRKDGFVNYPRVLNELDLVEEEDQITHKIGLDDELDPSDELNLFKYDDEYISNEEQYNLIKSEILGQETTEEEESDEAEEPTINVIDKTGNDLIQLRKSVYLTIKSSLGYEECTHKLLKLGVSDEYKSELPNMLIDCCSDEKTFNTFYSQIGIRLCMLNPFWGKCFESHFAVIYENVNEMETNPIRNVGSFYAHLLVKKVISWEIFKTVYLSESKTSSSTRILMKFLLMEMMGLMGTKEMKNEFNKDENIKNVKGLFPKRKINDARFAVNYWTSIKMGFMTDELRQWIREMEGKEEHGVKKQRLN
eukprot:NODE_40_length_29852_cov_0.370215.p3 type:complete len:515 gc:universal NODE_40_length_29852_cov_0.370215:545-2089(+)